MYAPTAARSSRWRRSLAAVACKGSHSGEAGGEIAQTWTPSGAGVGDERPDGEYLGRNLRRSSPEKPPAPLSKDTWSHAQKLYTNYKNAPLWLTGDGLDKARAGALMLALADGSSDGLRLQDYPLAALGAAIDTISNTKTPTAEQLANVDVMLTADVRRRSAKIS